MLSQTLREGLEHYSIGEKLRALRLRKKLGLVNLGEHTGLSPALLSKIERGRLFPTLPTLLRIALVFDVGLNYFFAEQKKRDLLVIVTAEERLRFPEHPGVREVSFLFESLDFPAEERKCNAYLAEFQPVRLAGSRLHQHSGIEFLYVISGNLGLWVRTEEHRLKPRTSVYFDANIPHGYRRLGPKACTGIVVTIP